MARGALQKVSNTLDFGFYNKQNDCRIKEYAAMTAVR